jgi:hypothetical protein
MLFVTMVARFQSGILARGGLLWRGYEVQWDKGSEGSVEALHEVCKRKKG